MKIAYLITKPEFGGAQSHVLALMTGVRERHDVALATGGEGWLAGKARSLGARVTIIPDLIAPVRPRRDWLALGQIKRWLRSEQPDFLHAHSSKAGLLGRVAARGCGVPTVFTAHGWAFTDGASAVRKLLAVPSEWLAARCGGEIICVSRYDTQLARRFHIAGNARLHTVWNGMEDIAERASPRVRPVPMIIMVARFAAPKDHETLLRAIYSLRGVSCRLQLVGDGPLLVQAQALTASLGLQQRVSFLGARADVPELLAQADVFVLSTRFEGLPISIIEAMRAGLPVVASSVGGVPELVDDDTGLLVPAGRPDALARALETLLAGGEPLLAKLGLAGRRRYERDFTAGEMIAKTLDIYRACLPG